MSIIRNIKTINLYSINNKSPEGSLEYEIINFPDGEVQIKILNKALEAQDMTILDIIAPVRNANELFILLQVLKLTKHINRNLYLMYLMSARNDRDFEDGRAINTEIVDSAIASYLSKRDRVYTLDPHNKFRNFNSIELASSSVHTWFPHNHIKTSAEAFIIFPDKGAYKRYFMQLIPHHYTVAEKDRDVSTGWINKYNIDVSDLKIDQTIYIVDDLVDGGSTFRMLAEELKDLPNKKILIVTHVIQPDKLIAITEYYDYIYVTNSYSDAINHPKIITKEVRI